MSKLITYICDCCKKQTDDVYETEIKIPDIHPIDDCYIYRIIKIDLCDKCYKKISKELLNVIKKNKIEIKKEE